MAKPPSGATVASLIGVITIILLFYIIFLPPSEREKLLTEERLIDQIEGRNIFFQEQTFPSLHLFETEEAIIADTINPFRIKKTIFWEEQKNKTTYLSDPENIKRLILTFQAPARKGILNIWFNGVHLYRNQLLQETAEPVEIPIQLIKQKNDLIFTVEGNLLQKKEYEITDAKLIADVAEKKKLKSETSFVISREEMNNVEKLKFRFFARCTQKNTGQLIIKINEKIAFKQTPTCGRENIINIARQELKVGRNIMKVELESGELTIEGAVLSPTRTMDYSYNIYERDYYYDAYRDLYRDGVKRFTLGRLTYEEILDGRKNVEMIIRFSERGNNRAEIDVNGRILRADQTNIIYARDISSLAEEGTNTIRIISTTTPIESIDVDIR